MLPIRHKSIFKNRWIALLWAGGIIWSAVEFVGGQQVAGVNNQAADGSTPAGNDAADTAAVQSAMNALGALK